VVRLATSQDFVCDSILEEHMSVAVLFVLELHLGRVRVEINGISISPVDNRAYCIRGLECIWCNTKC
jgi:hypothetical protein